MPAKRALAAVLVLLLLAALPLLITSYFLGLVTQALILAIFAMSLDLLLGRTGLPSLGHSAFFGTAAYTVALLSTRAGLGNSLSIMPLAIIAAGLMAAIFGLLAIRARGAYFFLVTLALAQVLWGLAMRWRSLTGGDDGILGIPRPDLVLIPLSLKGNNTFYYFTLLIAAAAFFLINVILRSPFGKALVGIRESESRMSALGYNVWVHKYAAFVVAGLFAGVAGVLFAYYNGYISPWTLGFILSAEALLMVVFGGAGTLLGPVVGAGALVFLQNIVSGYSDRWLLVLGLIYISVAIFAPKGIFNLFRERQDSQ